MVLYGIKIVSLAEQLFTTAPDLLALFYADYATFDGMADRSDRLMTLLLERELVRGYFPVPVKSLFIYDFPAQEETMKKSFESEGLRVNMVPGRQ